MPGSEEAKEQGSEGASEGGRLFLGHMFFWRVKLSSHMGRDWIISYIEHCGRGAFETFF